MSFFKEVFHTVTARVFEEDEPPRRIVVPGRPSRKSELECEKIDLEIEKLKLEIKELERKRDGISG